MGRWLPQLLIPASFKYNVHMAIVQHTSGGCLAQVGSKNAAFYMGRCIRVATKPPASAFVHELGIAAEALEERYREKQVS